jgi:GAF domain-containing protein
MMSEPGSWSPSAAPSGRGGGRGPERAGPEAVLTIALDTLARASNVAAAASAQGELQAQTASALAGPFADWVFVDLFGCDPTRAVAATRPDAVLARALTQVALGACPLIRSAVRRRTPLVQASVRDQSLLGTLPGGEPVITALGAHSVAVGPIMSRGAAAGAIAIARCARSPLVSFLELGVLARIADLTGVAAARLASC